MSETEKVYGGESYNIWVDADNGDDDWKGTILQPVATVTAAVALVSSTRKNIIVLPCAAHEYEEAAAIVWPTISDVSLTFLPGSQWQTVLKTVAGEDDIIHVAPGVQTSTWAMWIKGAYLEVNDGQDGLALIHTDMTKKMMCYLQDFGADCASDDEAIKVTHGGDGNAVRIYMQGNNGGIAGIVYHQFTDAGDKIVADGVHFDGGFNIGTAAKAAELTLRHCLLKHEGVTGGNATQVLSAIGSYSVTGTTYAIIDDTDISEAVSWDTVLPAS